MPLLVHDEGFDIAGRPPDSDEGRVRDLIHGAADRRLCGTVPVHDICFRIDGDDLVKYRAKIEDIIDPFRSNFKELTVDYMQDPYYTQNKIFYAALGVRFRDFEQTEYFKITALSNDTEANS